MYNIFMHIKFTTRVSRKVLRILRISVRKKPGRTLSHRTSVSK